MKKQITLTTLFFVVFLYALLFAFLTSFGLPPIQQALAIGTVTIFVGCELVLLRLGQQQNENNPRTFVLCAYYATSFAIATLACAVGFVLGPPLAPTSGGIIMPAVRYFAFVMNYVAVFTVFSSIGFIASLFALRRSRAARWLLAINSPGVFLLVLYCLAIVWQRLNADEIPTFF